MKPDWSEAPKWANYLAMDESGVWFWYEYEPSSDEADEWLLGKGKHLQAGYDIRKWRDTLEVRPKPEEDDILEDIDSILKGIPYNPCGMQAVADEILK